jgi:hypothetical protein
MIANPTVTLPTEYLDSLVAELDYPDLLGIALGGSYVRGEATPYSDVDLACFVGTRDKERKGRFECREGKLVSIRTKSIEGVRAEIQRPERAIWVVPGLSNCRILLDKDGSITSLLQDLAAFKWEPLQDAADKYASAQLMGLTETVHKILSEILKRNEPVLIHAALSLMFWLTDAVAVQQGIFVKSDSTYFRQVYEVAGPDWTQYHKLILGVGLSQGQTEPISARALAALSLYRETVNLLKPIMQPDHLAVTEHALDVVREANLTVKDYSP